MNGPFDRDVFGDRVGFSSRDNDKGGNHCSVFDTVGNSHISWDTDADGDYLDGSGHSVDHASGETSGWGDR